MRSSDISSPFDPVYDRLVHKAPTRSRESAQILDCLRSGRSVVVVCLTGDGALDFARSLATTLPVHQASLLRVTAQTTAADLREFTDPANCDGGPRIICGAQLLPPDTESIISHALHVSRVPIAYLVDGDRLRALNRNDHGPLSQIAAGWSSGALERIDLARLTSSESLALVTGLSTTVPLDDLQLRTLAALSAGRPLIAADLVAWAEESPHRVPQRYPHASVGTPPFGHRLLSRLTDQYPLQREDTLVTARRLGDIGPMPLRTAKQLFGDTVIARLIDLRLARELEISGQPSVAVSPLHVSAMDSAGVGETSEDDDRSFRRRLETMWRAGYPIGEVASIDLARDVINDGLELNRARVRLLLGAARALNRLGDPMEATVMLVTVEDAVRDDPLLLLEWELQSITARLVDGDREGAVKLIRAGIGHGAMGCEREPVCVELLFVAGAALASYTELPQWWTDFLRDVVDPLVPGIANLVSSFTGSVMTRIEDVLAVLESPQASPALRLAAMAAVCQYHLKVDDAESLTSAAKAGFDFINELVTFRPRTLDDFTYTMTWYFAIGVTANCLLAGVEHERSEFTARMLLAAACGSSSHSGWQRTATAAWSTGILRLLEGEVDVAARDYEALAGSLNPALLAVGWGLRDTVRRWQRSNAPYYRLSTSENATATQGYRLHDGLTALLFGPGSAPLAEMPPWMGAVFTHARFLDGTLTASEANESLSNDPGIHLPGPRAARNHIEAAAEEDPEALLIVGHELQQVGYRGAALHAFAQARALFLAQRLSARARVAGEALGALQLRASKSPEDPRPGADSPVRSTDNAPAVTLTERELEVCRLVAEGLTNVQISQRLVLSVRTVESHVLQARAKLGADRRRDIPMELLKLRDAGRINAVHRSPR
ncbi:helix-turn-helix transcriptional regulator [Brevibacterium zhoupengii]|uniref:helix-turn-helix transcriptional regulator n=1 Tax=Brevibacterium zhoupengii TaxID=2898795 RepID=UPI001E4BE614|nr:helix-turn-helix transcriptional regulator [Brevibacterium zhoupengii]